MNSSLFSNFRLFLGSLLIGVVSFYVFSNVILEQLQDIFHVSFHTAYYAFGVLYFILPLFFIFIWFVVYANYTYLRLTKISRIVYFSILCTFLLFSGLFIFYWNDSSILVWIFTILFGSFIIVFFIRVLTRPIVKTARHAKAEFTISFLVILILSGLYFFQNFDRQCSDQNKDEVLSFFELKKSFLALNKYIQNLTKDVEAQNSLSIINDNGHDKITIRTPIQVLDETIFISNVKKEINNIYQDFKKLQNQIENFKIDSISATINSAKKNLNDIKTKDSAVTLKLQPTFEEIGKQINAKYLSALSKKWVDQINLLTSRGMLILVIALLSLLCVHFYLVILKEEDIVNQADENDEIIQVEDKKYKIVKTNDYKEKPILQISSSGIVLILLLIIPILKPTDKEKVNLEKPFFSFNLFQNFEAPKQILQNTTRNYYIDTLIQVIDTSSATVELPERMKVDIEDFYEEIKNHEYKIGPADLTQLENKALRIDTIISRLENGLSSEFYNPNR